MKIDAKGIHYKELGERIRKAISNGEKEIILDNVNGQRYIGCGISAKAKIIINGVPGNDLAAFMDGLEIIVNSNGQDGIANTMNAGKVVISGSAGDILGYAMRGGKVYVRGDIGWRCGIHMKAYQEFFPVIIVGKSAGNFLGEYMAGGIIIVLGLDSKKIAGDYIGTGMHGGTIYINGNVEPYQVGKEVKIFDLEKQDVDILKNHLSDYCKIFKLDPTSIVSKRFKKLAPYTHRPYGKLYAY